MEHRVTTYHGHHLYKVYVSVGDNGRDIIFQFLHTSRKNLSPYETDRIFVCAMAELDKIYTNYGRFAQEDAVSNLFESYGFERLMDTDLN